MVELSFLLGAVVILGGLSIWRLFAYRFPHPADLATVSVFYYSLPLTLAALYLGDDSGSLFLHSAAADRDIAIQGLYYAVLAAACLQLGRYLAAKIRRSDVRFYFPLAASDTPKANAFILLLIAEICLGIVLFGPEVYFSGYNVDSKEASGTLGTALIYLSIEWLGLVISYELIVSRATLRRLSWPFVGLAVAVVISLGIARGKRLEVISALLPTGVIVFATSRFFRTMHSRVLIVVVAAVLISAMASLRFGEAPSVLSLLFNLTSEGLYAGHSLPGIIERINSGEIDYEYGARVAAGFLAFIPRFLWPDKDDMLYAGNAALDGVNPLGATSILAEVVFQGGATAVVLYFTILGFIFERVYKFVADFDVALAARRVPVAALAYLVIVTSLIPHFRDGLMPSIKIPLQSLAFLFALAGLSWVPSLTWRVVRRQGTYIRPKALTAPKTDVG